MDEGFFIWRYIKERTTINTKILIDKLNKFEKLNKNEYTSILKNFDDDDLRYSAQIAKEISQSIFGKKIFIRGLIEISSFCKNDCYYCGIRKSNSACERYRLAEEEIISSCEVGYELGFRTFVLQGGEDEYFTDEILCPTVSKIRKKYPDCAITLSLGERSMHSYKKLFEMGANRYLLRHESANKEHYEKLHPQKMSYENRINCIKQLKQIGFQTGCGFMVGSPFQTMENLANDLKFIEELMPQMVGIGPFLPHKDTPFKNMAKGDLKLTLFLLSLIRIMHKKVLLPATTALGTLDENGRNYGILCGANVVMPNLSPIEVRKKYLLYNDKISTNEESAEGLNKLQKQLAKIDYSISYSQGNY